MSTQTLADRGSWFGTDIQTNDGDVWVGSPLRVHRRCENPMFKISNFVAYESLMVYGTPLGNSPIGEILGKSVWIDNPTAEGSCAVEVELLGKLLNAGLEDPDVFFVTPFRIVAHKLREMIRSDL